MEGWVSRVRQFLLGKSVNNFSQQWLEQCTEWVLSEIQSNSSNPSLEEVGNGVLQQWLTSDLHDCCLEAGFLPEIPNRPTKDHLRGGPFCLQIDDLSQSSYAALMELDCGISDNLRVAVTDDETQNDGQIFTQLFGEFTQQGVKSKNANKSSRLIMMEVTDGVKRMQAMEKKFCPELQVDLPIGSKILLNGPLEVRSGTILLVPGSVRILGGLLEEIDQIAERRKTLEVRLREALNYIQNRQSGSGNTVSSSDSSRASWNQQRPAVNNVASFRQPEARVNPVNSFERVQRTMDETDDDFGLAMIAAAESAERQFQNMPTSLGNVPEADDEFLDAEEEAFLAAAAAQAERNFQDSVSPPPRNPGTPPVGGKRPREPSPSLGSIGEQDFDAGVSVKGFIDEMKLEIAEASDLTSASRPYFLTMPVALSDGLHTRKYRLGTKVIETLCGLDALEIVNLLKIRDQKTRQVVTELKRKLRDEVCGSFTLKRFPELAGDAEKVVIIDYQPGFDPDLISKWKGRRLLQKRPRPANQ